MSIDSKDDASKAVAAPACPEATDEELVKDISSSFKDDIRGAVKEGGDDKNKVKIDALVEKYNGTYLFEMLNTLRANFGDDPEVFDLFLSVATPPFEMEDEETGEKMEDWDIDPLWDRKGSGNPYENMHYYDALIEAISVCGKDKEKFRVFVDALNEGGPFSCSSLRIEEGIYKDDMVKMCVVKDLLVQLDQALMGIWDDSFDGHKADWDETMRWVLYGGYAEYGDGLSFKYEDDYEKFELYLTKLTELVNQFQSWPAVQVAGISSMAIGDNTPKFLEFCERIMGADTEFISTLAKLLTKTCRSLAGNPGDIDRIWDIQPELKKYAEICETLPPYINSGNLINIFEFAKTLCEKEMLAFSFALSHGIIEGPEVQGFEKKDYERFKKICELFTYLDIEKKNKLCELKGNKNVDFPLLFARMLEDYDVAAKWLTSFMRIAWFVQGQGYAKMFFDGCNEFLVKKDLGDLLLPLYVIKEKGISLLFEGCFQKGLDSSYVRQAEAFARFFKEAVVFNDGQFSLLISYGCLEMNFFHLAELYKYCGFAGPETLVLIGQKHNLRLKCLEEKFVPCLIKIAQKRGPAACRQLAEVDDSLEVVSEAAEFIALTGIYDKKIFGKYCEIRKTAGQETANAYVEKVTAQAMDLITGDIPETLRKSEDYEFMVKYVFPKGDYSDYETNAACGDRMEDLKGFKFEKGGYPAELSGVRGYKLRADQEDNQELFSGYERRLQKIRTFVGGEGAGKEKIKEAFGEKVEGLFRERAHQAFVALAEPKNRLTLKEKIICLFLTEIIRRKQAAYNKSDHEIYDLVVEYKYIFLDDLEAYFSRTADSVKRYGDEESRRYYFWKELSNIYGEDIKHVLRNDLFREFAGGKGHGQIEDIFLDNLEGKSSFSDSKQFRALEEIFGNEKIPAGGKFDALKKQLVKIFIKNVKFENPEERKKYIDDLAVEIDSCGLKDNFSPEFLYGRLVPALKRVRQRFICKADYQIEQFFSRDLNAVNAELSRFDPVLETEIRKDPNTEKENSVTKKPKIRAIRGFFMKTAETANARMGAHLCTAADVNMWNNPDYFEFVMKDEESGKCVGMAMLLKIEVGDRKYLWFGPNPFESFLDQVSSKQCYEYMKDVVADFARENDFDGVIVPVEDGRILGDCTNRSGDFPDLIKQSRISNGEGKLKDVDFGRDVKVGEYEAGGTDYVFNNGALIWSRKG